VRKSIRIYQTLNEEDMQSSIGITTWDVVPKQIGGSQKKSERKKVKRKMKETAAM